MRLYEADKPRNHTWLFCSDHFWVGIVGWQSAYSPTEKQKDECYETAHKTGYKTDECKSFWERTTSDPVALFNLILAISTVGLWSATISLYRAAERQFSLGRQEFIATHRPKVIVRFIQGPWVDEKMRRLAYVNVVNVGTNPAIIEEFGGDVAYRNKHGWLPPGLDASPKNITPVTLASGQRHLCTGLRQKSRYRHRHFCRINAGAIHLYCRLDQV